MNYFFLNMPELLELVNEKIARLIEVRESMGLNAKQFAELIGEKTPSNYYQIEAGKRVLGNYKSNDIVNRLNLNPVWFETGHGPMYAPTGEVSAKLVEVDDYEAAWLPYFPVPLQGGLVNMSDPESNYGSAERIKVIIRRGENVEGNLVFEVSGDSMYPKYSSGTKVRCKRIKRGDWEYMSSGVYAISYNDSFVVKRIKDNEIAAKGILTLHSDNPSVGGSTPIPISQIHAIWKVLRIIDSPAD